MKLLVKEWKTEKREEEVIHFDNNLSESNSEVIYDKFMR